MRFGSVCSGIEAAWLAEIEPFPAAVLAHHYPDVQNLGDMTTIARRVLTGDVEAPDMLCGGTPCQAFSVAGLRYKALGNSWAVPCVRWIGRRIQRAVEMRRAA